MKLKKLPTLAYLCTVSILIALGIWQLGRAEQKRSFFEQQKQGLASSEILELTSVITGDVESLRYKNVQAIGHYDQSHQFLIDNQVSNGRVGYFVLTPFIIAGQSKAVLVNRGWVPLNQDRSILPDIQIVTEQSVLKGRINNFPSVGLKLADAEIPTKGWPSVLQVVDARVLSEKLGYSVAIFQVELDKNLPEGFKREWQVTTIMPPEQHLAYAVQWFALAATLTVLFFWYSIKRSKNE